MTESIEPIESTETMLVVGASGFVGGAAVDVASDRDISVVGTAHRQSVPHATVTYDFHHDDLTPILDEHDVDIVVFAAAVEQESEETFEQYCRHVDQFVEACRGRRLVYLSSDSVFEGTAGPYSESDPRDPTTEYGRRLVAFEDSVRGLDDTIVVRPGYVFGFSRGQLDPRLARTRRRLADGKTVERFDDMYKSPIAVSELANAVISLATSDHGGVVHVGGPRISVYQFHCDGMRGLGLSPDGIEPTYIPDDLDVPPDLSLTSNRLQSLVGLDPSTVRDAM